jgi:polyisoprenoid-binding protein YceI
MLRKILFTVLFVGFLFINPKSDAKSFKVDAAHSTVGFSVSMAGGLSKVTGKFSNFTVDIDYDETDITKSSVVATIKATSIDTGIEGRDNHLRTADFFEVEKYPEITFKSKRVEKKGKKLSVVGDFTMHGVTKEIIIPFTVVGKEQVKVAGRDGAADSEKSIYGFAGTIKLDRRDYGINYQHKTIPNWISYEVEINLFILTR